MVKTIPEKIDDAIFIYLDKSDCMKVYFDDTKACKKEQCTCETCQSLISGTVVCCITCKKWYHDACQNATKDDLKKKICCKHCMLWQCYLKKALPKLYGQKIKIIDFI